MHVVRKESTGPFGALQSNHGAIPCRSSYVPTRPLPRPSTVCLPLLLPPTLSLSLSLTHKRSLHLPPLSRIGDLQRDRGYCMPVECKAGEALRRADGAKHPVVWPCARRSHVPRGVDGDLPSPIRVKGRKGFREVERGGCCNVPNPSPSSPALPPESCWHRLHHKSRH